MKFQFLWQRLQKEVRINNFAENDIYVSVSSDVAPGVRGTIRIPSNVAQLITVNVLAIGKGMAFDTLYVYSAIAEENSVEIQRVKW